MPLVSNFSGYTQTQLPPLLLSFHCGIGETRHGYVMKAKPSTAKNNKTYQMQRNVCSSQLASRTQCIERTVFNGSINSRLYKCFLLFPCICATKSIHFAHMHKHTCFSRDGRDFGRTFTFTPCTPCQQLCLPLLPPAPQFAALEMSTH